MKKKDMGNKITKDEEIRLLKKHIKEIESLESERKQVEEEMRILSSRQTAILASVPDIIMEVDNNKIYTWANAAGQEFFGDAVIGKEASYYFEGEQKTNIIIEPLFKGDENIIYLESWQRRKDGEKRLLAWWCRVLKDKNDNVTGALSTARDITERKQVEEAQRDSRYMLQTVLDSIPAAVFWKDRDSIYLGGNRTWLETVGLKSSEEVVGKSDYDLPWEKKQTDLFREYDRRVMESGIPEYDIIEPYLRVDDTHAWAKTNKVPLRDTEGNVVGVLGTYEDITERKQAEEVLRISKERLSLALEGTGLGTWDHNYTKGEIIRNERWAEMLGYTFEEINPNLQFWESLIHPDDIEKVQELTILCESGTTDDFKAEYRMKAKNGEWKWILDWGKIVEREKSGKPLRAAGTHLDITEMKKVEYELRKYSENQAILVREINHRVRNNLTAIIGMLYAEEDLARVKGTEECLPILRKLETRIKGLATAHSMLSEGEWQPLRVTKLYENVINATVKSQYSSKTVNIAITPSEIYVDSNQAHHLAMVINELAMNSLKYAVQNKEKVNISINAGKDGEKIIIQFHDDGPGYPIEMLKGDFSKTSTGFDLINGIVKKSLFGEVELSNDNGAVTKIIFKNFEEKNKSES